jgi:hypothetical protein
MHHDATHDVRWDAHMRRLYAYSSIHAQPLARPIKSTWVPPPSFLLAPSYHFLNLVLQIDTTSCQPSSIYTSALDLLAEPSPTLLSPSLASQTPTEFTLLVLGLQSAPNHVISIARRSAPPHMFAFYYGQTTLKCPHHQEQLYWAHCDLLLILCQTSSSSYATRQSLAGTRVPSVTELGTSSE